MKIIVTVIALLLTISSTSAATLIDRSGNFRGSTTRNADGSTSGPNGERTVGRGNKSYSYDSAGQLTRYGIQRGNMMRHYNRDGRYLGYSVDHGSTSSHYDARGRLLGTAFRK